jgi:hypothetical protein
MTWYDDLFDRLDADATFNGLVAGRIYIHPATGTPPRPFVTWQRISCERDHTHGGPLGIPEERIQFMCWDEQWADAQAVADALRGSLDGASGTIGSTTGCVILIEDEGDMPDIDPQLEERQLYGIRQDYWFAHRE